MDSPNQSAPRAVAKRPRLPAFGRAHGPTSSQAAAALLNNGSREVRPFPFGSIAQLLVRLAGLRGRGRHGWYNASRTHSLPLTKSALPPAVRSSAVVSVHVVFPLFFVLVLVIDPLPFLGSTRSPSSGGRTVAITASESPGAPSVATSSLSFLSS